MPPKTKEKSLKVNAISVAEQEEQKEEFGTRSLVPPQLELSALLSREQEEEQERKSEPTNGSQFADSDESGSGDNPNSRNPNGTFSPFRLKGAPRSDSDDKVIQNKKESGNSTTDNSSSPTN